MSAEKIAVSVTLSADQWGELVAAVEHTLAFAKGEDVFVPLCEEDRADWATSLEELFETLTDLLHDNRIQW